MWKILQPVLCLLFGMLLVLAIHRPDEMVIKANERLKRVNTEQTKKIKRLGCAYGKQKTKTKNYRRSLRGAHLQLNHARAYMTDEYCEMLERKYASRTSNVQD